MKRICIRVPNWLGDSVMARRFVTAVRRTYPAAAITLVAHRRVAAYWRSWPDCEVIDYDPSRGRLGAIFRTAARVRASGPFDAGFLLTPSLSSALLFALAGIGRRVGFVGDARGWLLSEPHPQTFGRSSRHFSEQFMALLATPDSRAAGETGEPVWPQSDRDAVDGWLAAAGLQGRRYVVVAVGTEGDAKRYPAEAWIGALRLIASRSTVICVGTPGEAALTEQIASAAGSAVIDWCGRTGIGELAVLLQGAAVFAGADSGAAHLAASVGTPTVVIFGPGNPVEVSPQGADVAVLREPLWCSPCGRARCPRHDYPRECLDRISPSVVADAVLSRIG